MPDGGDDRVSIPSNLSERVARVEEQIPALDRHMAANFARVNDRFDQIDKATALLAKSADRIQDKLASEATEQKQRDERAAKDAREQTNEWRGTVTDLAAGKADVAGLASLRNEFEARIGSLDSSLSSKIDTLVTGVADLRTEVTANRAALTGGSASVDRARTLLFGLLAAAGTVVGIVIAVVATGQ